ncbi:MULTISPECIES: alpha/beta hydrolase [unclassified Paraburkholderia]|uniref:alpha/beta hydrolase n=1 Tax=unclassified Paraburkholderia TaxID=2615204 RepID=UPI002AB25301|nr:MULTISPECIES: alpha/beta hydrolase [unclassified Paraburkholderia]
MLRNSLRQVGGLAALVACLFMGGCVGMDRNERADTLAASAGLKREQIATDAFVLTAFVRVTRPDAPIDVYIEGDGLAWISRTEPSLDPTPREPTGLALAAVDPAPNVAYIARPCQYSPMSENPRCAVAYWTDKRFSSEVVSAMNAAVDQIAARAPGQPVNLTGYSGGGAIAVLLAAQRRDIGLLRTVAGNLDDEYVNAIHHVSPMPGSLNPIDFASRVGALAQVHFSGADDTIVPPEVARRFVAAEGGAKCVDVQLVAHMTHGGEWQQQWPRLLSVAPSCMTSADTHAH